ncbi:unnamed protein product [Caenorhabditis angaria]|uniref:Uncharacterized protein n=1 Tax=Caenorhabditis angaria TaxID=860376 RepID=A0A9P1MX17_9PELO|nr:unnamed protein product [Caenorhabditis angaria]
MDKQNRRVAGRDDANIRVKIFGVRTELWILFFAFNELIIGITTLVFYKFVSTDNQPSESGFSSILWVLLYLLAVACQSKTMFTFISIFSISNALWDFVLFYVRLVIVLEPKQSYQLDNIILFLFSWIKVFTSFFETFVILKLGWCIPDKEDDRRKIIKKILRETGPICENCTLDDDQQILENVKESMEQLRISLISEKDESSLTSVIESS